MFITNFYMIFVFRNVVIAYTEWTEAYVTVITRPKMGNSGGKNRTHPSEEGPSPALMDPQYGDIYDKDQHRDYDSGVRKRPLEKEKLN